MTFIFAEFKRHITVQCLVRLLRYGNLLDICIYILYIGRYNPVSYLFLEGKKAIMQFLL